MCGIAGIISNKVDKEVTINKMLSLQSHRGPDNTGVWASQKIALGHNRLAILDLNKASNQPFFSNCGNYILVFNGEIYNYLELKKILIHKYTFKTSSDTEVLLAAYIIWGKDCLEKLNGMFSFAVWDCKQEKLFAARDRFGVKPFYYHKEGTNFYFSSEIKALHNAEIKKEYNESVWSSYFSTGSYGMPNETFWENIQQLSGGHCLEIVNNNLTIFKWYNFEEAVFSIQKTELSYEEVKNQYTDLLKDSIQLRLQADVQVGFNVSGGLDSSALLGFVNMIKGNEKIKAFTFYTGDHNYDELPWVEEMIGLTKFPLEKVHLDVNKVKKQILKIAETQDEPFGGIPTLAYSKIFETAREKGTLVLLDGQGMDEQWAGYDYYTQDNNNNIQGISKSPFRPNILHSDFFKQSKKNDYPKPFNCSVLNKQYRDLFYTKIPRALRFNDRISMAYSTELREPFLDYRLVEFAFAQPLSYKIKGKTQKYLLRDIVSEILSDSISYAPKRPLQTPQREWFGNELFPFIKDEINKLRHSKIKHWFHFDKIDKELDLYKMGDRDSSFHIWQWLNASLLIQNYE